MSETLSQAPSAEERVFGNAFTFAKGAADQETVEKFFDERIEAMHRGETVWIPRMMEADRGIAADLFHAGREIAIVDFDYETSRADMYSYISEPEGVLIADQVLFEEAVAAAEALIEIS